MTTGTLPPSKLMRIVAIGVSERKCRKPPGALLERINEAGQSSYESLMQCTGRLGENCAGVNFYSLQPQPW
jgi:hypothetical protein